MDTTPLIFLRIALDSDENTVRGAGKIERYEERIPVDSFSFSLKPKDNQVRQTTGAASGSQDLQKVSITKAFDNSSFALSVLAKEAKDPSKPRKFTEARLTVDQHMLWAVTDEDFRREQNAIIVLHLLDGHVSKLGWSASEQAKGASIKETLELTFRHVEIEYYEMDRERSDAEGRTYRKDPPFTFVYRNEEGGDGEDDGL